MRFGDGGEIAAVSQKSMMTINSIHGHSVRASLVGQQ